MKLLDLLEMSASDIEDVEKTIRHNFEKIGIIVKFSNHFSDRIKNDAVDEKGFKRDNITTDELLEVFNKLKKHHEMIFAEAKNFDDEVKRGEFEGVIMDVFKKINVPFTLEFNKNRGKFVLTCKTIMKRDNFHVKPKDHVIALRGK